MPFRGSCSTLLAKERTKPLVFRKAHYTELTIVQLKQKTISYQYIFCWSYNMCPRYAWIMSSCRPSAAYHTMSKVSGIDPGVKSSRVGIFRDFMFVFKASWQARGAVEAGIARELRLACRRIQSRSVFSVGG